jgi:hypothetical protein
MRCEVRDVDAPEEGPVDLGPTFAQHLVAIGVLPQVVEGARESAVTGLQRRCVGERTPAVLAVF